MPLTREHSLRILTVSVAALLMGGCVFRPEAKVDQNALASGPKYLAIQIEPDPNLVAFDLRTQLENQGFRVDDTTTEPGSGLMVLEKNKVRTYDRVTDSPARYVLVVGYTEGGYPYRLAWRARIVDREAKRTLSTYAYDWNAGVALNFKWSNEQIIADMIKRMVNPVFSKAE